MPHVPLDPAAPATTSPEPWRLVIVVIHTSPDRWPTGTASPFYAAWMIANHPGRVTTIAVR